MRRFQNILVVCNGDESDKRSLPRVAELAERNDARLTLLRVVGTSTQDLAEFFSFSSSRGGPALADEIMAEHLQHIEALASELRDRGLSVEVAISTGTDFIEVIRRVLKHDHDLVTKMVAPGGASSFLPSQDMHLMRKCPCPVWIFNTAGEIIPRRILAAVNPDPEDPIQTQLNVTIMELATSMAAWSDARLDVMSVWRLPEESMLRHGRIKLPQAEVDAMVDQVRRASEWRLTGLMGDFPQFSDRMRMLNLKGVPADTIVNHVEVEEIDLVVMGTLSRTGVAGFLIGNTAETILSQVRCSVMTVKPRGFVSPVTLEEGSA